jgi:hypothetical protein
MTLTSIAAGDGSHRLSFGPRAGCSVATLASTDE